MGEATFGKFGIEAVKRLGRPALNRVFIQLTVRDEGCITLADPKMGWKKRCLRLLRKPRGG